jgi:hypothetical protein
MDWDLYKKMDADVDAICEGNPVLVAFTYGEFIEAKQGILLLRRIAGNTGDVDLENVDRLITPVIGEIRKAFAVIPGVKDIRDEQMRMLEESNAK